MGHCHQTSGSAAALPHPLLQNPAPQKCPQQVHTSRTRDSICSVFATLRAPPCGRTSSRQPKNSNWCCPTRGPPWSPGSHDARKGQVADRRSFQSRRPHRREVHGRRDPGHPLRELPSSLRTPRFLDCSLQRRMHQESEATLGDLRHCRQHPISYVAKENSPKMKSFASSSCSRTPARAAFATIWSRRLNWTALQLAPRTASGSG
mmetsp:Transcript_40348/g.96835  ORF Transcript_40348/g.96835 Transcript_40348/m.96835 type:complete len:205 (-) Transcript_40348:620-1234(-)